MPIFQCKSCRSHLPVKFHWESKFDGVVNCTKCDFKISVTKGIPVYLPDENCDRLELFDTIYDKSDQADPWNYDLSAAEHVRYLFLKDLISKEFAQAKRVLDMGCSGGHLLEHLHELPIQEYFAFDISLKAILQATTRLNLSEQLKKRVTFFVANATALPIEENSFDLVLCIDGIIGWELNQKQREEVFSEIRRVLKPGGHVIFVDYISRTSGAHLYPKVFTNLKLDHRATLPIYDRLSYEFESAIKALLTFSLFRQWKKSLTFAKALSKIAPILGKNGAKHWAFIASKTTQHRDILGLSFFVLSG